MLFLLDIAEKIGYFIAVYKRSLGEAIFLVASAGDIPVSPAFCLSPNNTHASPKSQENFPLPDRHEEDRHRATNVRMSKGGNQPASRHKEIGRQPAL